MKALISRTMVALALALTIGTATVAAAPMHPDEQVTVTCHTDRTRCVAIRVDTLGNVTTDRYATLHDFMGWYENVTQEFVEQVTVYLSDDWAEGEW